MRSHRPIRNHRRSATARNTALRVPQRRCSTAAFRFSPPVVVGCLLLAGVQIAYGQDADLITLFSGPPVRGMISTSTNAELTVSVRGSERKIDANQIKKLRLAGEPEGLRNAREDVIDQKYTEALERLNKIDDSDIDREIVRQEVKYLVAYCKAELALGTGRDVRGAAKAMSSFVKGGKDNIHYYDAVQRLGDLAMASGNPSFATRVFSQMARAPWPEIQMRANIREAQSLAVQDKQAAAIQKYDQVLQSTATDPQSLRQKSLAQVAKAGLEGTLGETAKSIKVLEEVIAKNDPQDHELFARTYNALGNCYLQSGDVQDAILAFLHTHLIFYQAAEAHAEALYHLGNLWGKIGKSDRATESRNLLKSQYAGSPWAQK